MLSALFGRKAKAAKKSNSPWDELRSGKVNVPIWRTEPKEGVRRYYFGLSKPYVSNGVGNFGKTFGVENFWDVIAGLEDLALKLSERPDISDQDRAVLVGVKIGLEQALLARRAAHALKGNGRDDSAQ